MLWHQHGRNFMRGPGYDLNILQTSWIPFFESTNSIISCTCSSTLELREKFKETKKWTKYSKKSQNCPNFWNWDVFGVGMHHEKNWMKKQKNYSLPTGLRQRSYADGQSTWPSAKEGFFADDLTFGPSAKGTAWAAVSPGLLCRRPFFT
jgi:hypothetical protein